MASRKKDGRNDQRAKRRPSGAPQDGDPVVVGIGASAGGLAALRTFFDHVPVDSGLAFVVVVHLSPEHESHLADLLQFHVKIPVQQVSETTKLEKNNVYVIPPGSNLNTIDTHLRLSDLEERRRERAPIDHFLRTLASTHDGRAIAVILTGTGSDGTLGIRDVKAKGGLIIVQDPAEAEYDGMPQSAISTGVVDLILPAAEIPAAILKYTSTEPQVSTDEEETEVELQQQRLMLRIFGQLRARTGRDFSRYKRSTTLRRIARRMQLHHIELLDAYIEKLKNEPEEVRALADDLLVTVTSFFRDSEVFEVLESQIIPGLFERPDPIRIWSVGCATGEEAYSLAMLLSEEASRHETPRLIQVFASDLHGRSLSLAREGVYPGDIEADVGTERLRRFFQRQNGGYRIRKEVRELVVFAPHNLLADPPFSRLDLISCRNLLIYLQRNIQTEVINLFHYALKPDGYLLLGTAETLDNNELFRAVDKERKIHQKRNVPVSETRLPVFPLAQTGLHTPLPRSEPINTEPLSHASIHHRMVERYAAPSILLGPDDRVLHLSEQAGRYLLYPGGIPTQNVYKLIREELRLELRAALHALRDKRNDATQSKPIPVSFDGDTRMVVVRAQRSLEHEQEGYALVIFDEWTGAAQGTRAAPPAKGKAGPANAVRIRELQAELDLARQRLQTMIEQYETSQEEMKASVEELQSTNEELRSTMEELETSKEELQSMNEELQTVNQENRHKVEELALLSSDLQNLLTSTDIATLFLDRNLRILRFTPKLSDLFNIRLGDRGRPILDLTHRLGYEDLQSDAHLVLAKLIPVEREIQDDAGNWYLTRVLPYRSTEDRIEGVVITFVDITGQKRADAALQGSEERLRRMLNVEGVGVLIFDELGSLVECNAFFRDMFGYSRQEVASKSLSWRMLTPPEFTEISEEQYRKLERTGRIGPYEKQFLRKDGSRVWLAIAGAGLGDGTSVEYCIDIGDRKQAEANLWTSERRLAQEVAALSRLHQMSLAVVGATDFKSGLDQIMTASMDLLASDFGYIQLWNPEHQRLELISQVGFDEKFEQYISQVAVEDDTPCARAFRTRRRVVVEDLAADGAFPGYREAAVQAGFGAVQSTPLVGGQSEVIGVLSTHSRERRAITDRDSKLLDMLSRQASLLIGRLRTEEDLKQLTRTLEERVQERTQTVRELASQVTIAEQRERQRIAQVLHDDLQQLLYSIQIKNKLMREAAEKDVPETSAELDQWLDRAILVTRQLSVELGPQVMEEAGLEDALAWLAGQMKEQHGLTVDLAATSQVSVSKDLRILLFRIVRELLFNVVKHSGVSRASVEIDPGADGLCIVVRDGGKGFLQTEIDENSGFGIASIRHQLSLFDSTLDLKSIPGDGTVVTISVPASSMRQPANG